MQVWIVLGIRGAGTDVSSHLLDLWFVVALWHSAGLPLNCGGMILCEPKDIDHGSCQRFIPPTLKPNAQTNAEAEAVARNKT
jgi:hypothetical protein